MPYRGRKAARSRYSGRAAEPGRFCCAGASGRHCSRSAAMRILAMPCSAAAAAGARSTPHRSAASSTRQHGRPVSNRRSPRTGCAMRTRATRSTTVLRSTWFRRRSAMRRSRPPAVICMPVLRKVRDSTYRTEESPCTIGKHSASHLYSRDDLGEFIIQFSAGISSIWSTMISSTGPPFWGSSLSPSSDWTAVENDTPSGVSVHANRRLAPSWVQV